MAVTLAPAPLVQRVRLDLALPERSPLDYHRHAVPQLRDAMRLLVGDDPIDELAGRAGNKGAKSYEFAAYTLACLQKRPSLNGELLPQWRGPVTALALVLDYEQQKLSTQKHVLTLLGKWPYVPRWKGGDILGSLLIQPINGNDDRSTWSKLVFQSQENRRAGLGARADIVWADEPPIQAIWDEARKAGDAGRRGIRLMGFTPIFRRQWAWIRDQYGDTPRGATRRISQDWAECRWSIYDNSALTQAEIAKQIRQYTKDAMLDSRIFGDYMNDAGACPFDVDAITAMLAEIGEQEPEIIQWRVPVESDDGVPRERLVIPVEVYALAKPGASYYIPIDPSAGVDDSRHDPAGLHVREIGSGDLAARAVGPIRPYSLGVLAAGLARQYNNAVVQPEVNDGFGMTVVKGLHDAHYGNIGHELRELSPGQWSKEIGFRTTHQSRADMIGAIQAWIESWRVGVRYARCPSRKVLECLLDCVLDGSGKPIAAPGLHDEDLVLWGQGLRRAVTRSGRMIPDIAPKRLSSEERLIAMIEGDADEPAAPFGQVAVRPRARPRF